jgi:pilus assembly protein CpaB
VAVAIDDIISTSPSNPRESRSRRSALRALIFTVIALGAGGTVASVLKSYVERHATRQIAMGGLVVATTDLPLATTLEARHLTVVPWPAGALPEGAISDPRELVGRVLLSKLVKNEAVLSSKILSRDSGSGLAALLPENTRAVAVRVDDVVGVAGFVHPDDHVDVIVTMRPDRGGETISRVFLQNVRVLAVGQDLQLDDQKRNRAVPVTVATLQVTTEESEMLALATAQGRLLLSLRPWADKAQVGTLGVGPTQLLGAGRPPVNEHAAGSPKGNERSLARVATPLPIRTAMLPPSVPANDTIEILRGDRFEQRKFESKAPSAGTGD